MKILIVDDKQEARYLLRLLLEGRKHEVIAAENGKEALQQLEEHQVDLIISDILMPEMDGFKFCQILKRDETRKNIPFVFYTATYVDKKDEKFSLDLGADLFLRKPIQPELLLQEIDKLCEKIKAGKYTPSELTLKREADIYKLYNERLIHKLEHKIDRLEEEIERREKVELELKKTVAQKEVLLRELYHRTRNNMQIICSMLKLYTAKFLDDSWNKVVSNIISKIKSIALAHRKLCESRDLSHLNLQEYLTDMINLIRRNFSYKQSQINISTDLENIEVLFDTAIPVGFVINELLTNAVDHAFPENKKGNIMIKLQQKEDDYIDLELKDDGIGLPDNFDINSDKNLGLNMIRSIVQDQMHGTIDFTVNNGTLWQVKFKKGNYSKRV